MMKKKLPLLLLCMVLALYSIAATTVSTSTTSAQFSPSPRSSKPRRRSPAHSLPILPLQARRGGAAVKPKRAAASATKDKKISLVYPILAAYLYNLSIGFTVPVLPKIINMLVNDGDPKVSPASARMYGLVQATDQAVTFLLVNGACLLSDKYGRRPLMALANVGLGTGQLIASLATNPRLLLLGAAIDGATSFSYPLAQSYIADITPPSSLPQALGLFQGVATGGAFLLGIPLSGLIAAKKGLRLSLYIAAGICATNVLFISAALPESLPPSLRRADASLLEANVWGAVRTVATNPFIALCSLTYFLLHLALNGLQINFVNYSQYKFGWNVAQSSASLCLIFIFTALFPRLLLPLLGIRQAIQLCSCLFAVGFTTLGLATTTPVILLSLIIIAAGSVSLPATLALLTNQAPPSEKGSLNGAADTVRTLSSAIGFPLMTSVFAYFISEKAPFQLPGAALFLGAAVSVLAFVSLQVALRYHDHHDKSV